MSKYFGCPASHPTGTREGKLPPHPDRQTPLPCSPSRSKVLGGGREAGPARPWLRRVSALPGGAAPRARGFLSGRRQRHSDGGHGGGLWGAFICPSSTPSPLLAAGRVRDSGVAGAPKLSGEAAAGRFVAPLGSRHLSPAPFPASDGSSGNHAPRNSPFLQDSEQTDCRSRAAERRAGRGAGSGDGAYGEPCGLGRGAPGGRIRPGAGVEESWGRSGAHAGNPAGRRGGLGEGQAGLGAAGA